MEEIIEDRIKEAMSAVFNVPADEINDESSPNNIQLWDSLKHIQLVITLEEEFGITLEDEESVEMLNYSSIKHILAEKLQIIRKE